MFQRFLNFCAGWYVYLLQWKYLSIAWRTIDNTVDAGYDAETATTRADEAIALQMLEDCFTRDFRIRLVRDLTQWEVTKAHMVGQAVHFLLMNCGWTKERIKRRIHQLQEKVVNEE